LKTFVVKSKKTESNVFDPKIDPRMATQNFYLKKANKKGLSSVIFVYQDRGQKFKHSTKVRVDSKNWDGERVLGNSLEILEDNKTIQNVKNVMNEISREALIKDCIYDIQTVERKFRLKTNSDKNLSEFYTLYDQFISESRATKCKGTVNHYSSTKNILIEFEQKTKYKLSFESVNMRLYNCLTNYLIQEKGLLNNSVGMHIKILKSYLNFVRKNELTTQQFSLEGFKVMKEDIDIIYLTEDELFKLYYYKDLSQSYEYVKDYFCFECFTGLRFSDITKLQNENIKGDFLEFKTQKTKDTLFVPLSSFAKEILDKYKGKFENRPLPPILSNQKTNQYLKHIAEIVGIDEMTIIEKFSGSRRIQIKKSKCDLVCTHTGRRTFITLSYEKGMPVEMIMKITGLKKWDTLKKYMKVSERAKLIEMNKVWKHVSPLKAI
jgi:integrase